MKIERAILQKILEYVESKSTIDLEPIHTTTIKSATGIANIDMCAYYVRTLIRDGYIEPFQKDGKIDTTQVVDITMKGRLFINSIN